MIEEKLTRIAELGVEFATMTSSVVQIQGAADSRRARALSIVQRRCGTPDVSSYCPAIMGMLGIEQLVLYAD